MVNRLWSDARRLSDKVLHKWHGGSTAYHYHLCYLPCLRLELLSCYWLCRIPTSFNCIVPLRAGAGKGTDFITTTNRYRPQFRPRNQLREVRQPAHMGHIIRRQSGCHLFAHSTNAWRPICSKGGHSRARSSLVASSNCWRVKVMVRLCWPFQKGKSMLVEAANDNLLLAASTASSRRCKAAGSLHLPPSSSVKS